MNKLLMLLLPLLLLSCEKYNFDEDDMTVGEGECSVTFCVSELEQIPFENALETRAADLKSLCSRITLSVFSADEKVKNINQQSSDGSFGSFTIGLAPGTYRVVVLAHNGQGNATVSTPEKITFASNKCTDTFYYYGEIEVTESFTQHLSLKRAVAAFRMKITDAMPAEVAKMQFYYTGGSSTFNAVSGYGCVNSKQTEPFDVTSDMKGQPTEFQVYTFPHAEEGTLKMTVSALGASGDVICEKTFDALPVTLNKITCWTGTFFQPANVQQSNTLSVSIDNDGEWAGMQEYQ